MPQLRNRTGMPPVVVWLGIGALSALVIVLVFSALQLGDDQQVTERPAPTVAAESLVPAPPPTEPAAVTPELTPALAALSVIGTDIFWRSTATTCTPGPAAAAPVIERSADGATWADVTPPAAVDVREVLWLQAINASSAEAVALVGPDCETQVLRTFTTGTFWEPYPSSITGAVTVDVGAGLLHTSSAELPLPCPAPAHAVTGATASTPTVLCAGQVASWSGAEWQPLELSNVIAASVVAADGSLVTAREATLDCEGVLLERWVAGEAQDQRCIPGAGVLAVQAEADRVWLWSAAGVESVPWTT